MTSGTPASPPPHAVPDRTLVAIHGVGSPTAGDLARDIVAGLALDHDFTVREGTIEAGGEEHPRLRLEGHPTVRDVIEVNWSDIEAPPRGPLSLMLYLFRLVIAMTQMGATGWRCAGEDLTGKSLSARVFAYFITFVGTWIIGLPLISLHVSVAQTMAGKITGVVLIGLLTLLTTFVTARYDRRFRAGYLWTAINLGAGAFFLTQQGYTNDFVAHTAFWVDVVQLFGFGLILLAGAELLVRLVILAPSRVDGDRAGAAGGDTDRPLPRGETVLPFFVRFACLFVPALVLTGLAALIFLLHLLPYTLSPGADAAFSEWVRLYRQSGLNAQSMHQIYMSVAGVLGAIAFVIAVVPFALSLISWNREPPASGRRFQTALAIVLTLVPVLLLPSSLAVFLELLGGPSVPMVLNPMEMALPAADAVTSEALLNRAAVGAVLLLAVLVVLLGPGRTVLDVTGDVIFYVLRDDYIHNATAGALTQRVKALLTTLDTQEHGPIVLVGYSQGSVIAADAARGQEGFTGSLITIGSPIQSLYGRFLKIPAGFRTARVARWDNLFRPTDFVGGPIGPGEGRRPDTDQPVRGNRRRHHVNYWPEPEVRAALAGLPLGQEERGSAA